MGQPNKVSVLLVEDDPMLALVLEESLDQLGYAVSDKVARVADALIRVERRGFDVALVDVNLGGEDSFAVADRLLAQGVPFVFTTGYRANSIPDRFEGVPLMTKPFRHRDIDAALKQLEGAL